MNFSLNDNLEDKFYDTFDDIREKSNIDHINYVYESNTTGTGYRKTTVSDKTLFKGDNPRIIPSINTKYLCNVDVFMQSVHHSAKDKDKDVVYYSQVLLEQCCYEFFVDTRKIGSCLKHKKKNLNLNLNLNLNPKKRLMRIQRLMNKNNNLMNNLKIKTMFYY